MKLVVDASVALKWFLQDAALVDLRSLSQELPTTDADYVRAMELSHRLNQHLFDALYHAVALERGAVLVTADERYHTAAAAEGAILRLSDFTIS